MNYEMIVSPFEYESFETLKPKEAEEYFEWYVQQIDERIRILKNYIISEDENILFDYSSESLIPLWEWYEKKIVFVDKTPEELKEDMARYPSWMHNNILTTKISMETLKYGMDLSLYFAEVIINQSNGKINWGYFTKPKKRMSVNEPVLLGFKDDIDLNPRLIISNCTRRSKKEFNSRRLFDMYETWMAYIE